VLILHHRVSAALMGAVAMKKGGPLPDRPFLQAQS
jgi:hypothetical protein